MANQQIALLCSPWFRDLLDFDPRDTFEAVKCPVLALNGAKDLQVAAKENLTAIREALQSGGNQRDKIVELPNVNHLFQSCTMGAPTEYGEIEETLDPAVLSLVCEWIRTTVDRLVSTHG